MEEAYVRLLCPECSKGWQTTPRDLPEASGNYTCENCHATRRVSEFMRTEHDLQTLKELQ